MMNITAPEHREKLKGSGRRAFANAAELSFPRLVGTPGESEAREKIAAVMTGLGLEVSAQKVAASDFAINFFSRFALLIPGILLFLAGLAYANGMTYSSGLFALPALLFVLWAGRFSNRGFTGQPLAGKLYPTENIVGTLPSSAARATVIVTAHYDSKSQTYPVLLRIVLLLLGTVGTLALAFIFPVIALAGLAGIEPHLHSLPWISALVLIIDALPAFNRVHNLSDGALDNAAGVGVMLEIARLLKEHPPADLEIRFVATAAEELGLCGASALIDEWKDKLDPQTTCFINYDSPGSRPGVMAMSAFGIPKRPLDRQMNAWIKDIAAQYAIPLRMLYLPVGAAVDLVPIMSAGFRGVNLSTMVGRVHTPRDTIDRVNESGLEDAVIVGYELVMKIADETSRRSET